MRSQRLLQSWHNVIHLKQYFDWFSVALAKFHWFGINWHVFNQSECRNCCLYTIIRKIAPHAKSGKYFQIWFFPRFGKKNGGVLSMRTRFLVLTKRCAVSADVNARPRAAPCKGREERRVQGLNYTQSRLTPESILTLLYSVRYA